LYLNNWWKFIYAMKYVQIIKNSPFIIYNNTTFLVSEFVAEYKIAVSELRAERAEYYRKLEIRKSNPWVFLSTGL